MGETSKTNETAQLGIGAVSGSVIDVLNLAREALMNASGAYNALRLLGAEKHLPGLSSCEDKREEALEAIEKYLHATNSMLCMTKPYHDPTRRTGKLTVFKYPKLGKLITKKLSKWTKEI